MILVLKQEKSAIKDPIVDKDGDANENVRTGSCPIKLCNLVWVRYFMNQARITVIL